MQCLLEIDGFKGYNTLNDYVKRWESMAEREIMVSVFCTAYNHEEYIREALDSFVGQKTDFAFEVLVNDDCSSDGTAAIIEDYARRYPEIIRPFIQKENLFSRGVAHLYSTVFFPNARGKYVAYCEGDDKWSDDTKLQQQVDFLESHEEYSGCVHNTLLHYCAGDQEDTPLVAAKGGDCDIGFDTVIKGMNHAFHTSSIMARREYIVSPPDFYYAAADHGFTDYAIALWLCVNGKVRFIDRLMSVYRISSNPAAWSAKLSRHYARLTEFIRGEIAMMEKLMGHVEGAEKEQTERELKLRRYELLDIKGQVEQLVSPEYADIFRSKGFSYRLKTRIKILFPALHRIYRKRQGYGDY